MNKKKIVLFIVEGINDQTCLAHILSEILTNQTVQFEITDGDITSRNGTTPSNISAKIGSIVKDFSNGIFQASDFQEVIHLIDTDGAFIPDEKIEVGNVGAPLYEDDKIITSHPDHIQIRNHKKTDIIKHLMTTKKVWKTIPYRVFYFSCNLDHVLYNKNNLTKQEKAVLSHTFDIKIMNHKEDFLKFIKSPAIAPNNDYESSWHFIMQESNSLKRYTNFNVFFHTNDS